MIPFKKVNLGNSYQQSRELFESGRIGYGNIVGEFEKELALYTGAKYALCVNSCTSALYICLLWEKMRYCGTTVIIPSMTQALVANAVISAGFGISFSDDTTWIGGRYQLGGTSIIDSAQQLKRDDYVGLDGKTKLCFSFYPTKPIGSTDGGAIVTNDLEFITWARSYILYGRDEKKRYKNSWEYDAIMLGGKYNFTNLSAMICLEQLRRLDNTNARRTGIANRFNAEFFLSNDSSYLYRINVENRDKFIEDARNNGIECGVHFKPLHLMPPFQKYWVQNRDEVEDTYRKTVSLPFYDLLTDVEISYISSFVQKYIG